MATITTRAGKGSPLTNSEVDSNFTNINTELGQKESASNKGVANGYASLDGSGKVPSAQLPSYVDDVVEGANLAALPATGETGKIYVTLDTNKTYRWSGSAYVEISASPGSTDAVTEGSTNLYFTNARARAALSASGSLSYNSSTGVFSYTQPTNVSTFTNDSAYITTAGARSAISASGSLSYNSSTGVMSFTDAVTSVAGRTGAVTLTSSDVGLGNVENKSSATIRGEITSSNVTTALGFTPLASGAKAADAQLLDGYDSTAFSGPNSTIKQFFWNDLAASGTQARTFEIARLGIDFNDWNSGSGPFEVELYEGYYSRGLKKRYVVNYGYVQNASIQLVEYSGTGDNNFQCRIGSPVQVSGDQYYLPVFVDVRYYAGCDVRVTTNRDITTNNPPGIGSTFINQSPSATNISDFTADSIVNFASTTAVRIDGNQLLHAGNYTSYSPSLTGGGASGTWGISVTGSAASLSGYYRADDWLRTVSDAYQFKIYGNTRSVIFRTDGVSNPYGGGADYAFNWFYGGGAAGNRIMLLGTSGDLWTNSYGWLHDYFLPKSGGALNGATINGQTHYQWEGATYRNPGDWTATLIARRDNSSTGINGHIPALVIYNNNGGDQTTAGISFATAEGATGAGNSVALAGIVAKKESSGNVGGWSAGSLNFYVKNFGSRVDAMTIGSGGSVNILNSLTLPNSTTAVTLASGYYIGMGDWGLRNTTPYGWIQLGPANSSWCHIYGSQAFYFNQALYENNNRVLTAANYNSYALPLSGGTLTGHLNLQQPYKVGFANGQYIQDNGAGGLAIYSGAALNFTGTSITASGQVTITPTLAWNNATPALNVGGTGDARLQVRHIWGKSSASAGTDHLWLQYDNPGNHVQIGASTSGNNLYVGGSIYTNGYFTGNLVLNASNYSSYALPLSGGTVTGSTTFNSSIIASGRDIRIFENDSFIEFYVGGDANTYYPVRFDVYAWFHFGSWSISRSYGDTAPWDPIGTGAHRGGLTLTWEWSGDGAWGGNDKTIRVNQFSEQYTTMVGGMALSVNGIIVWLRGGNAYYRFHGPGGMYKGATPYYSTYTASNGATFSPRSYNSSTVASEVISRMPIRNESEHYDGNNRVLHAGNYTSYSPSLGGSGASGTWGISITGNSDTVDGLHASSFTRKDTTGQWIKPYYEYGNYLTSESPSTLASQMGGGGLRVDFLHPSYTGSGGWNHVITWSGYNFYNMYQLGAHYDGGTGTDLWVRSEANHGGSSWTAWRKLLNSSNYNSYSPTLTGGGASGTWGINISGSAAQLNGYASAENGGSVILRTQSNGYLNFQSWINVGGSGLYSSTANGSHFYPNNGSYGSWRAAGSRNTWNGIEFDASNTQVSLMCQDNGNTVGWHANSYGWKYRWASGTLYVYKGSYGGGTEAVALDSSNYTNYTFPLGGGWYGSGLPGSRWLGSSVNGGEFVLGNGLPNAGQIGILIDGCYVAGENNGFWSMASDNTWGSRRGMYWDGTYLNFTTNSATTRHSAVYSDGNVTAYSDERVKTNWREVQENFVFRLAGVKSGIFDRTDIELTQAGVSAQSMREVLPEVVIESNEGTLSVAYGNAAMVSAVELAKELVQLKRELAELKSKLH